MANNVYIDIVDNETPVSQATFNELQRLIKADIQNSKLEALKLGFPIGQPYITQSDTDPSTILGFGTWQKVEGEVLVGIKAGDADFATFNQTVGEKTHTMTVDELAKHLHGLNNHTHGFSATSSSSGRHSHGSNSKNGALGSYEFNRPVGWDGQQYRQAVDDEGEHTHTVSGTTGGNNGNTTETGRNKAFNILQPTRVVGYMWIRTG